MRCFNVCLLLGAVSSVDAAESYEITELIRAEQNAYREIYSSCSANEGFFVLMTSEYSYSIPSRYKVKASQGEWLRFVSFEPNSSISAIQHHSADALKKNLEESFSPENIETASELGSLNYIDTTRENDGFSSGVLWSEKTLFLISDYSGFVESFVAASTPGSYCVLPGS